SGGQVPPGQNQPLLPIATSDAAPVYAFNLPKTDITAFVQALQTEGLATILAQPKLLAMSGQNAVFQVGGEIPIRIATGFSADIEFKPFGTLINFIPQVSDEGDIMLTVTPEVSQPDFNSPVEGIPSFRTRRASTSTRLRNGETLVIGGLLQTNRTESVSGVPYLQNLPLVGYIFRNTHYESQVTELMVIITPHLVQALPPGQGSLELLRAAVREFKLGVHCCTYGELPELIRTRRCELVGIELGADAEAAVALIKRLHDRLPTLTIFAASDDPGVSVLRAVLEAGASDVLSLPLGRQ